MHVIFIFLIYGLVPYNTYKLSRNRLAGTIDPAHDKTYNKTCVTSKDSDQPVHPPSMAKIFVYPSLDRLEAVEGTCNQQRLWSNYVDAQADMNLHWSHKSYCRFCHVLAQFIVC